jgi:hypothetical protein
MRRYLYASTHGDTGSAVHWARIVLAIAQYSSFGENNVLHVLVAKKILIICYLLFVLVFRKIPPCLQDSKNRVQIDPICSCWAWISWGKVQCRTLVFCLDAVLLVENVKIFVNLNRTLCKSQVSIFTSTILFIHINHWLIILWELEVWVGHILFTGCL